MPCMFCLLLTDILSWRFFSSLNAWTFAFFSILRSCRYSRRRRFLSFFSSGVSSLGLSDRTLSVDMTDSHMDSSSSPLFCARSFSTCCILNLARDFMVSFGAPELSTPTGIPVFGLILIFL